MKGLPSILRKPSFFTFLPNYSNAKVILAAKLRIQVWHLEFLSLDTKFAKRTISLYFVFVNFDDFSSTRSQFKKLSLKGRNETTNKILLRWIAIFGVHPTVEMMIRNFEGSALKNITPVTFTGLYETNSNQIKNTTLVKKKKIEGFMMFTEHSSSKIIFCQFFYN
jgi:hypothetical protein